MAIVAERIKINSKGSGLILKAIGNTNSPKIINKSKEPTGNRAVLKLTFF